MTPHFRYLRYVLLHKLAVFRAGMALRDQVQLSMVRWVWRLLVHDLSKFGCAEWGAYVAQFYGPSAGDVAWHAVAARGDDPQPAEDVVRLTTQIKYERKIAFDRAWLHHQHHNPHHWQHWILREDSGKTLVLTPHSSYVDEMIADWMGAGPKARWGITISEMVAETIVWYAANSQHMLMRTAVRERVELTLILLSRVYGVTEYANHIRSAQRARQSLVVPGR